MFLQRYLQAITSFAIVTWMEGLFIIHLIGTSFVFHRPCLSTDISQLRSLERALLEWVYHKCAFWHLRREALKPHSPSIRPPVIPCMRHTWSSADAAGLIGCFMQTCSDGCKFILTLYKLEFVLKLKHCTLENFGNVVLSSLQWNFFCPFCHLHLLNCLCTLEERFVCVWMC